MQKLQARTWHWSTFTDFFFKYIRSFVEVPTQQDWTRKSLASELSAQDKQRDK